MNQFKLGVELGLKLGLELVLGLHLSRDQFPFESKLLCAQQCIILCPILTDIDLISTPLTIFIHLTNQVRVRMRIVVAIVTVVDTNGKYGTYVET